MEEWGNEQNGWRMSPIVRGLVSSWRTARDSLFAGRRLYVVVGAVLGIANFVVNIPSFGASGAVSLTFMIIAFALVTLLPLRPIPCVSAYLCSWILLLVVPGAYVTDMIMTNLAYFFFLGRFLTTRAAAAVYVATILAQAGATALHFSRQLNLDTVGGLLFCAVMGGLLVPVGAMLRSSEQSRADEAERAGVRLEELRREIAREMHDLVAYSMSQTALRAQRAAADTSYPAAARNEFTALEITASDALHELRLLLRTLRQETPAQDVAEATGLGRVVVDLGAAIRAISDDVANAGFDITYRCLGETIPSRSQASTLSRVAREMGANIVRHGDPSSPVTLTLSLGEEAIRLVSTNRIHDATSLPRSGTGLLGMRERLAAIDGTLTTLADDGSWIITASVPVVSVRHDPSSLEKTP